MVNEHERFGFSRLTMYLIGLAFRVNEIFVRFNRVTIMVKMFLILLIIMLQYSQALLLQTHTLSTTDSCLYLLGRLPDFLWREEMVKQDFQSLKCLCHVFHHIAQNGSWSGLKLDPGPWKAVSLSRPWLSKQKINLKAKYENSRLKKTYWLGLLVQKCRSLNYIDHRGQLTSNNVLKSQQRIQFFLLLKSTYKGLKVYGTNP